MQVRQPAFVLAALVFSAMSAQLVSSGYGPPDTAITAPYIVVLSLGLLTLPAIFYLTIVASAAALRDRESGMTELVDSTPTSRRLLYGAKFAGAVLGALTVLLIASGVLAWAPHVLRVAPSRVGEFHPWTYAWAFVVLVVPNVLFAASLVFSIGVRTGSSVASWVTGVALVALYFVSALLIDSPLLAGAAPVTPAALARAALLDPLGLSAFFEQTRYWNASERGVRTVALAGHLLLNRVVWLTVSAAALLLALRPSRRVDHGPNSRTKEPRRRALSISQRWLAALLAVWALVVLMTLHGEAGQAEYFTTLLPATGLLVEAVRLPISLFGTLIIALFAGEVVWRERMWHLADVVDATPSPNARFWWHASRSLLAIIGSLLGSTIALGVSYQLARAYVTLEPTVWLSLLVVSGLPLLQLAVLALLLQAVSPNRWVGMLLTLVAGVVQVRGDSFGALEHPLMRYGAAPALQGSDMRGFGAELGVWGWFMLCWSLAAIVLGMVSIGLWPRGRFALRARGRRLKSSLGQTGIAIGVAALLLCVAVGVVIARRSHATWESSDALVRWRVDYEKAWRRTADEPTPSFVAITGTLDLEPAALAYTLRARAILRNLSSAPIDTVRVVVRRNQRILDLSLDGARQVASDERFGVHTFALDRAMAPGDSATLRFALAHSEAGLRAGGFEHLVSRNGSVMLSPMLLPSLGYRAGYELTSPSRREQEGLPPATAAVALDTTGSTPITRRPTWYRLELTVSTAADQQVVATGRVVREWVTDGRRYVQVNTDTPIPGRFGVASAHYAIRTAVTDGIPVSVYYHPSHAANVAHMLDAAQRSLALFQRAWGPYPFPTLRLVEVPAGFSAAAFAVPGVIFFTEDRGFLTDARDSMRFDLVTRRVAHEVAHMWWGNHVAPAEVEGAAMIVETLAKHGEQLVLRERWGDGMVETLLSVDGERYRSGAAESGKPEPGLWRVVDQEFLYYGKGALVMRALRDSLGAATLDRSLRRFAEEHGGPSALPPTTVDLLRVLSQAVDASRRPFVERLFRAPGPI